MNDNTTANITRTIAGIGLAVSKDDGRPSLQNVHVHGKRIEAINGHIAVWTDGPESLNGELDGCWNGKAWSKLRGLTDRDGDTLIDRNAHTCKRDTLGDDVPFPNLDAVIPTEPVDVRLYLLADTLRTLLKSLPEVKGMDGVIQLDIILDPEGPENDNLPTWSVYRTPRTVAKAIRIHANHVSESDVHGLLVPCRYDRCGDMSEK